MGDTLGVVGGGQLGRYFVLAARSLGYRTMVLEPDPHSPAGTVADHHIVANYDDPEALERLAESCIAVTVEFENPPVAALEILSRRVPVRPAPNAVAVAQDRRLEKRFCRDIGLGVADYAEVDDEGHARLLAHRAETGLVDGADRRLFPGVLKTARMGYDGKGQVHVEEPARLVAAFHDLGGVPCVFERRVVLTDEFSIIVARGADGATAVYAPTRNEHAAGVLDASSAPFVGRPSEIGRSAALHIADRLDYVGVLAVEFFVTEGSVLVNEIAPRPHNSGHWTLDGARTSQFEQQVRALVGAPLGDPAMIHPAVAMVNLLGDRWAHGEPRFQLADRSPGAFAHLYGKREARPGRKMGHLTVVDRDPDSALARARTLREAMTISGESGARR